MKVNRICFLGTRTPNFDATSGFFRDVLGLSVGHAEPGWSVFQLPSGRSDFVEVFGPEHDNTSLFPAEVREGIVVAFAVGRHRRRSRGTGRRGGGGTDWRSRVGKRTLCRYEDGRLRLVLLPRPGPECLRHATGQPDRRTRALNQMPGADSRLRERSVVTPDASR